jgi:peroxiredoxin
MKKQSILSLLSLALMLVASSAFAAKVGAPAPDFSAVDSKGVPVSLSQFKGKYVVLEWHNKDCPYVKAQYKSGNMQKLQKEWTAKGVAWLVVDSSATGTQGNVTGAEFDKDMMKNHAAPTDEIIDTDGKVGHAYGAQTTPHMFVIDPNGMLVYNGAIDSKESTDTSDIPTATNYVNLALNESMNGKALSHPTTKPYGCGVKY